MDMMDCFTFLSCGEEVVRWPFNRRALASVNGALLSSESLEVYIRV